MYKYSIMGDYGIIQGLREPVESIYLNAWGLGLLESISILLHGVGYHSGTAITQQKTVMVVVCLLYNNNKMINTTINRHNDRHQSLLCVGG